MPDVQCPPEQVVRVRCAALNSGESGITLPALAQALEPFLSLESLAVITDQKPAGTESGSFISGAWRTRDLNTILTGADNIQGLSSNRISLLSNDYLVWGWAPSRATQLAQTRIQDITNNVTVGLGLGQLPRTTNTLNNTSQFLGFISAQDPAITIEIQHQASTDALATGFGASGFGTQDELYTTVYLLRFT